MSIETTCPTTGKQQFQSEALADAAIIALNRMDRFCSTSHSYKCEDCGFWHTTSGAGRKTKAQRPDKRCGKIRGRPRAKVRKMKL